MTDLVLILAMVGFIALCVAYVGWCNRIIGVDDVESTSMRAQPVDPPVEAVGVAS